MQKNKIFAAIQIVSFLLIAGPAGALTIPTVDSQARTRFQEAKQNYATTTNAYQQAKRALNQVQTRLENAGEDQKNNLQIQLEEKAREFFGNSLRSMKRYLEAMKNKVENVRGISESNREKILDQLDGEIAWLSAKAEESKNASGEQLKNLRQEIQNRWRTIRRTARRLTGQTLAYRVNYVIEKAEILGKRVGEKLKELKGQGKDVSVLETKLADFEVKITESKKQYDLAREKFQSVTSATEVEKVIQEGRDYLKKAAGYLREAQKILSEIIREMKKLTPNEDG